MRFEKGNQAAAKPSRKAVAALIAQRLETGGDSLSDSQFTTLAVKASNLLTKRRPRHRKDPEARKFMSFADRLVGQEAEDHRLILEIEAERLEARRKEWQAKQTERNE